MSAFLISMLGAYPEFTAFLAAMGFMRAVNKPLFALIQVAVNKTDTNFDNEKWKMIKDHKVMKSFLWALDFTASVKVPKK